MEAEAIISQPNHAGNRLTSNPASSDATALPRLVVSRQRLVIIGLSGSLWLAIIGPVVHGLPIAELNRPLADYVSMALLGVWILLHFTHPSMLKTRPRTVAIILWLIPLSYLISFVGFAALGGSLGSKHLQILLFSMRPIVFVELTVFTCRWGRISGTWEPRLLRTLWQTLAFTVVYVSSLAVLQFIQFRPAQNFLYAIYRYEKFIPTIAFDAALWRRATSIFHWFNSLGQFLTLSILILYSYALAYRKGLIFWVVILAGLIGLVLSGSRASVIAVSIGILLITIRLDASKIVFVVPLGLLAMIGLVGFIGAQTDSSSRLVELWQFANSATAPSTLTGRWNRWGEFLYYYRQSYPAFRFTGVTATTNIDDLMTHLNSFDSEYLRTYTYNGMIGLGLMMAYQISLLMFVWRSTRRCRRVKHIRVLGTSLFAVFAIMPLMAFSQQVWTHIVIMNILFMFFGLFVYFQMNHISDGTSHARSGKRSVNAAKQ